MATLKDIAAAIGVSPSLVSKVLNDNLGTSGANPKLIKQIKSTAQSLGYRRNLSAALLKSGRHGSIGVMLHLPGSPSSGIAHSIIMALSEHSVSHSTKLQIHFYEGEKAFETTLDKFGPDNCDGLLIVGIQVANAKGLLKKKVAKSPFPIVTVYNEALIPEVPNIDLDFESIGSALSEHLHDIGCPSMHAIASPSIIINTLIDFLKAKGISIKVVPNPTPTTPFLAASARVWTEQLLNSPTPPKGLFLGCDDQAAIAIQVCQEHGLKVPEDIIILGVDNAPWGQNYPTSLTSIDQKHGERTLSGLNALMALIEKKTFEVQPAKPELVVRQSTSR